MSSFKPEMALDWVSDANETTIIRLVSGEDTTTIEKFINVDQGASLDNNEDTDVDIIEFHPAFTYPIFGELEKIFGKKIDDLETTSIVSLKADKVEEPMRSVLSEELIENPSSFSMQVAKDTRNFKPHGKKIHEYKLPQEQEAEDATFEIYENDFTDESFRKFHKRMQTFVLFYIEGGQFIDDTDEKWTVYTLYKKLNFGGAHIYSLVGFCTMYNYYHWPDKKRARISQFLILPPYQQHGHGSKLYFYIHNSVIANPDIVDLTVEDPNESFDDMRDKNDIKLLISTGDAEKIDRPLSYQETMKILSKYKFSKRQRTRVAELCLLRNLNKSKSDSEKVKEYRIWMKKRIYRQNYDALVSMEPEERKIKLAETYENVYQDYIRILSLV
ncbi:hypothetical protein BB559_004908 [Furculomyces boomerangus]|uniref:Histone acetyltransferase type B catalytic subunit n=1 Tax=Furculomyces boomerangus TaxID=61424 RepID=A0A2T9YBY1_9FUNG|nr:hypothetical protein BB559_004908 [Furculomyces boomerangus]